MFAGAGDSDGHSSFSVSSNDTSTNSDGSNCENPDENDFEERDNNRQGKRENHLSLYEAVESYASSLPKH